MAGSTESNSTHLVWGNFFESTSGMREWRHWNFLKFDFSATISDINAQFAPVNKGLNSASIRLQQLFKKYFRYAPMTSLKFSKFNFTTGVDNIYAQFAPVNRELNSESLQQLFRKYFLYAQMTSLKFSKFNFSAAISNIYAQFTPVSRGVY